jgi:WD40 repeat protein
MAFSPDGGRIISGCSKRPYIRAWDANTDTLVSLLLGIPFRFLRRVSPDGRPYDPEAICLADYLLVIQHVNWNLDALSGNALISPITGPFENVISLAFSLYGTRIVSGDDVIVVWDTNSGSI